MTVSKSTGLNPAGETITVTGSGFVPADGAKGSRPPLAGKFGGAYIVFGTFADNWKPSKNAPSSARAAAGETFWGVHADDVALIGGAAAGEIGSAHV